MRARIIAELDDIQDQSDASAVAKKLPFLMHCIWQHCHRSESQRRLLKTASEKVDFLKQTLKPASEESDLSSEIFDQAPDGMSKEEFENWLDIDNNAEVVATMTVSEICQAVADDKSK